MPSIGIQVRAGVHAGECEVIGDDLGGIAVHIGARIGAIAGRDEVLVSQTVKDAVTGSGISFDDKGVNDLKGVPGQWRLYAVAS
jgi:class 3 adenylate cyclase